VNFLKAILKADKKEKSSDIYTQIKIILQVVKQHLRNTICSNYQKKRQQGACIGISVPLKPDKAGKKSGVYCGQTAETNES
jgi:hypothetical protein